MSGSPRGEAPRIRLERSAVDLERARGVERPRIERAGPLLRRPARRVPAAPFSSTPLSDSRRRTARRRARDPRARAPASRRRPRRGRGRAAIRAAPHSDRAATSAFQRTTCGSIMRDRHAVRQCRSARSAGWRRRAPRRASTARSPCPAKCAPSCIARARFEVAGMRQHALERPLEQPPRLVRERIRHRRAPRRDRGLDGVRDRVEAGHRRHRGAARVSVSSGSRIATRNAAVGSPHAIFTCVAASEMTA